MAARPVSPGVWILVGELVALLMTEVLPRLVVPRVARRWL